LLSSRFILRPSPSTNIDFELKLLITKFPALFFFLFFSLREGVVDTTRSVMQIRHERSEME
jgi:hypothetical protein